MLDIMYDEDINNDSFMKFIKSDPDEESMCNTESDIDDLIGLGTKKDGFLVDVISCGATESDGRNSQPKMCPRAKDKQDHFGTSFLKDPEYELNLNLGYREEVAFGGFYDGPTEGIGSGLGQKLYSKRKLELTHELNKRQRYMDRRNEEEDYISKNKMFNSLGILDGNAGMSIGCDNYGSEETTGGLYTNPRIFKDKTAHRNPLIQDQNTLRESYDIVTGTMIPLRLRDMEKTSEPSGTFPLTDGGNYLLGEPLRDIMGDTKGLNRVIEQSSINYNHVSSLLLIGNHDKENVIDPRIIFKFDGNATHLRGVKKIYNNHLPISLTQENNFKVCLDANKNIKADTTSSKKFSLITSVDEHTISPKKIILLTYPTPNPLPERESGVHIVNRGGVNTNDIAEYEQKEIKKTDGTKAGGKNKPKISQKLLYIHNLSRSSNTKIDETVAYLHYKLRSYENMAVLTRIRNILQSHQLNLIGICGQLGIPELLVPRRTN